MMLTQFWDKWKDLTKNLSRWILLPAVCYLELLFHLWNGGQFTAAVFWNIIGFAVCVGGLLSAAAFLLPGKAVRWYSGILIFICTTIMMVELLIGDAYYNYMRPALIFVSAGGVLSDYADIMFDMIFHNLGRIFVALLPLWLLLLSGRQECFSAKRGVVISVILCFAGLGVGFAGLAGVSNGLGNVIPFYDFNTSMKQNGIVTSMFMEISGLGNQAAGLDADVSAFLEMGFPSASAEVITEHTEPLTELVETEAAEPAAAHSPEADPETTASEQNQVSAASADNSIEPEAKTTEPETEPTEPETEPTEPETEPTEPETEPTEPETEPTEPETEPTEPETEPTEPETEPTEPEKEYGPHVIPGLDFGYLAENEKDPVLKKLYAYVDALTPAMENEYTGLFAGKNLIFITAEAFNYAVIDPERTPTLYRLATQGIEFTNYYEPLWTGNTSGGELVNLSGLAMTCEMASYTNQKPFNTIGRQLMNLGYFSRAYHNNGGYFYDRDKTHTNLGYEEFIHMNNGMQKEVQDLWPQSDDEMMRFSVPQYIDQQPFSVYYMTISAHCRYSQAGNAMSRRNWDLVEDLPYSNTVKAYLAANMELEKGLTYLVEQLEQAGIADDTVIVLAPDHFPYGLGTAWGNDHDCLGELYGVTKYDTFDRDKNTLIIWSGCLEGKNLKVDTPVCSVDILPTLSNLFGVVYDSRLSVGRDVLGEEEAIAIWPDYSWVTEYGKYTNLKFYPFPDVEVPEGYAERISTIVRSRISFSRTVQTCKFFASIQEHLGNL